MEASARALESGDRYLRWFSSFWVVNGVGWLAHAIFTYSSFTLPYEQQSLPYIVHPFIQSAIGCILTVIMRVVYRAVWEWSPGIRIAVAVFASLFFSFAWTGLRMYTFLSITDEQFNLRLELPSWYYPGLLTFSLWTALYHALKYLRLLREQRANLLQARAERQEEQYRRLQAESVARDAQLRMLRYQLNPHFLFNTLNSIAALVTATQTKTATTMIYQLSQFLRYSLDSDQVAFVTVEQELEALRLYLDIEKVRFGDRLEVTFDESAAVAEALIPGLILQPLVENAIKYAIAVDENGGTIAIRTRRGGDRLCVTIEDSGPGLPGQKRSGTGGGVGLRNVQERLRAVYGDNQSFVIRNRAEGGVEAMISLPLNTSSAKSESQVDVDEPAYHAIG